MESTSCSVCCTPCRRHERFASDISGSSPNCEELANLDSKTPQLNYVDPLGYLEFNYLVKYARGVITDSGGITEETTVLGVPCLTLRDNTERPETITIGTNELIGTDPSNLPPALARLMAGQWKKCAIPLKWDGKAAERIVEYLERLLLL